MKCYKRLGFQWNTNIKHIYIYIYEQVNGWPKPQHVSAWIDIKFLNLKFRAMKNSI